MTDDETSISVLKSIAQARLGSEAGELPPDVELRSALAVAFGNADAVPASEGELGGASEGKLARSALDLLRQDPEFAQPIQLMTSRMTEPASRQRYIEPTTIALTTAALLVLQTRVTFKLDSNHKWSIEVDKKTAGDAAVKLLVQRLLPFLSK